jgi:hypothetical protein
VPRLPPTRTRHLQAEPSTPASCTGVTVVCRHHGSRAAEQRQRVEVDGDRAITERPLQFDTTLRPIPRRCRKGVRLDRPSEPQGGPRAQMPVALEAQHACGLGSVMSAMIGPTQGCSRSNQGLFADPSWVILGWTGAVATMANQETTPSESPAVVPAENQIDAARSEHPQPVANSLGAGPGQDATDSKLPQEERAQVAGASDVEPAEPAPTADLAEPGLSPSPVALRTDEDARESDGGLLVAVTSSGASPPREPPHDDAITIPAPARDRATPSSALTASPVPTAIGIGVPAAPLHGAESLGLPEPALSPEPEPPPTPSHGAAEAELTAPPPPAELRDNESEVPRQGAAPALSAPGVAAPEPESEVSASGTSTSHPSKLRVPRPERGASRASAPSSPVPIETSPPGVPAPPRMVPMDHPVSTTDAPVVLKSARSTAPAEPPADDDVLEWARAVKGRRRWWVGGAAALVAGGAAVILVQATHRDQADPSAAMLPGATPAVDAGNVRDPQMMARAIAHAEAPEPAKQAPPVASAASAKPQAAVPSGPQSVEVEVTPPKSLILRRGEIVGKSPLTVKLAPGEKQELFLTHDGYHAQKITIDGTQPKVSVNLAPYGGTAGADQPTPTAAGKSASPPAPPERKLPERAKSWEPELFTPEATKR